MVVLDLTRPRTEAGGSENAPALDVDLFDRAGVEIRVWTQTSNRGDRVHEANAARNHFREHRLEDHVVLSIDQRELDGPTSEVTPEELFQGQCRIDPAEAAAQDEDPCWSWAHDLLSSISKASQKRRQAIGEAFINIHSYLRDRGIIIDVELSDLDGPGVRLGCRTNYWRVQYGTHHLAQKSTSTGRLDSNTTCSKLPSFTSSINSVINLLSYDLFYDGFHHEFLGRKLGSLPMHLCQQFSSFAIDEGHCL